MDPSTNRIRFRRMALLVIAIMGVFLPREAIASERPMLTDRNWSMPVGAASLTRTYGLVRSAEDKYIPLRLGSERGIPKRALGVVYRTARLALLDDPMLSMTRLVQHEYFGHGARFREFGRTGMKYRFRLPPPYDSGGGSCSWGRAGPAPSTDEIIAVDIGGTEALSVQADRIRLDWVRRQKMSVAEVLLYDGAAWDLHNYIQGLHEPPGHNGPGNDMANYLDWMAFRAGGSWSDGDRIGVKGLKRRARVDLLDPFTWLTRGYGILYGYFWAGRRELPLPMIPIGPVRYLPSVHLSLAPFGPETIIRNYLAYGSRTACLSVRSGDRVYYRFWGGGLRCEDVLTRRNVTVGFDVQVWNQPGLYLGQLSNFRVGRSGTGLAAVAIINSDLGHRDAPLGLAAEVGGKTDGFVQGEALARGLIMRAGVYFRGQ